MSSSQNSSDYNLNAETLALSALSDAPNLSLDQRHEECRVALDKAFRFGTAAGLIALEGVKNLPVAWRGRLDKCVGYPVCDGDLVGEPHSKECPEYGREGTYKSIRVMDCIKDLESALEQQPPPTPMQQHGVDCPKVPHVGDDDYYHEQDNNKPFAAKGMLYCGRCHGWMGSVPPPLAERFTDQSPQDKFEKFRLRAATILCETRGHTGARPCDFCLNVSLFEAD